MDEDDVFPYFVRTIGVFSAGAHARFLGEFHRSGHDFGKILRVFQAVCAESVGIEQIAACV